MKRIAIALAALLVAGCATLQTQHQKIATACESAATAADVIAAGTNAGRIDKEQAQQALKVYRATVPFCQPPVERLDAVSFASLIAAAAQLTTLAEKAK